MGIHSPSGFAGAERYRFTGSMEGLPEVPSIGEARWRRTARSGLDFAARVLPGVAIAVLMAFFARSASDWLGTTVLGLERSPIPPILFAILLGLAIRNGVGVPAAYDAGLRFCVQRLLRVGVALLGLGLSLSAVGSIGLSAFPIVVLTISTALLLVTFVNRRMGLSPRLGTLIAVGTSICGNSAIVATAPAIGARDDETSYAVGCVTLFGLVALLAYPFFAHFVFAGDARAAGLFLGTAIHDTAQVVGAGMLYAEQYGATGALDTAMVTKLLRNLFIVLVIPGMAYLHHRGAAAEDPQRTQSLPRLGQVLPLFVFGFLALALLRTLGDLGAFDAVVSQAQWGEWIASSATLSSWLLAVAMAAVGFGTDLRRLRGLGARPLAVGFVAALAVGAASAAAIQLLV